MLNPERVELVRRRLGLTKQGFAQALGADRKTLYRFATGFAELNDELIGKLAVLSGYPEEFFSKGQFDYPNPDGVSFRSLRSLTAATRDSALAIGAIAFEFDDWITKQFGLDAHSIPKINDHRPAEAAAALRVHWGIGERPIGNMINLLELHGVRVFSLMEETRHLDAYSFWRHDKPYVFLNTTKTPEHSRFDAAHELGHLVMHRHSGSAHRSAEDEAHEFASTFLMPPADLLARVPVVRSLKTLIQAKKRWRVSASALNYALHKIGVIKDWAYRSYYIELNKMGRGIEPEGIEPETSQVWRKVLTALWREGTPLSKIADDLAVPESELSSLLFGVAAIQSVPQTTVTPLRVIK